MKLVFRISLLSALLFSNMFINTGCWNYREIDQLAIVAGSAIDKIDDKYVVTAEIVNVKSGKEAKPESKVVSGAGDTLFDALRNIIKITGKQLYWAHSDIIIISQEIAREGIVPAIDLFTRDPEARISTYLLISEEKTAKEILEQKGVTSEIHSVEINKMLQSSKKLLSKAPVIEVYQFADSMADDTRSAILPSIRTTSNEGQITSELSGTAVFKKDKLVGFLKGEDTKYFLFALNKVEGGALVQMEKTKNSSVPVALEISKEKTSTKKKAVYANGKPAIKLDVHVSLSITEIAGTEDYINEPGRSKLKRDIEKSLEDNIKRVIKKVQNDFGSDIFEFGRAIKDEMPDAWKGMEKNWGEIFKDLDVYVNAEVKIKNSSLLMKPLKIGA